MKRLLKSKTLSVITLVLSVLAPVFYYGSRATWIFIDITTGIEKFTFILLYLMIANCIGAGILAAVRTREIKAGDGALYLKKGYTVFTAISFVFSLIFFIAGLSFGLGMYFSESKEVYSSAFTNSLTDAFFIAFIPVSVIYLPVAGKRTKKLLTAAVLLTVTVIGLSRLFPLTPYKLDSKPSVLDTGKGYSIVFSTNDEGTGYVEYTYKNKDYRVYDQSGGRLNSDSRIHSISVPYEHLDNNTYRVGSVRVIEQYSYGSRTGAEVVSEEYTFTPARENMRCLVISDWHTYLDKARSAISFVGDYDAVILLGDATPGVDYEMQVVNNIVRFSGDASGGTKPVLYVRGNHETRGEYAGKLLDALGLDEFYYTAEMGGYTFVVLDSGEDKDDAHPEYGGMTDYNTYRADMIEWLKGVETENDKVIALSHSWKISDVEKELSEAGWKELKRLGARLMISGHEHKLRIVGAENETEKALVGDITAFIDGGNMKPRYVASVMTVSGDDILLESYNDLGEKVFEHKING